VKNKCPACGKQLNDIALQHCNNPQAWVGEYCPAGQERVYVSMPYGLSFALASLLSAGALARLRVKNVLGLFACSSARS
jgi:hypothetical protein